MTYGAVSLPAVARFNRLLEECPSMQCFCRNDEVAEHLGLKSGRGKKRKDKNKRRSVKSCCCKPNISLVN